jgi:hypothetical protein
MIIEILDGAGVVITKVNTNQPEVDMAFYGGVSWRPFVRTLDEETAAARKEKIKEVIEYRKETIDAVIDEAVVSAEVLYHLFPLLNLAGADPKWQLAYDIWEYAVSKLSQMAAWPLATILAYDPKTDAGWPS